MTQNQLFFPNCDDEDVFLIDGDLHKVSRLRLSFRIATKSELINPVFKSLESQNINLGWWNYSSQYFEKWISQAGQDCKLLSPGNPAWLNIALKFTAIARFYSENVSSGSEIKVNIGNANDILSFGDNRLYKIDKVKNILESKLNDRFVALRFVNLLSETLSLSSKDVKASTEWFITGKNCEYLKVGAANWQTGVIKLGFYVGVVNQQGEFERLESSEQQVKLEDLETATEKSETTFEDPKESGSSPSGVFEETEIIPKQSEPKFEEIESPLDSIRKSSYYLDHNS
jgi:KGK domain